jgi:hypothetical protein
VSYQLSVLSYGDTGSQGSLDEKATNLAAQLERVSSEKVRPSFPARAHTW